MQEGIDSVRQTIKPSCYDAAEDGSSSIVNEAGDILPDAQIRFLHGLLPLSQR